MIEIITAFGLKLCDNALGTVKTIFLTKNKYFTASCVSALGTFFYLLAIAQIAKSDNIYNNLAMCLATFLGTLVPAHLLKRSEPERLYIFDITADSLTTGKAYADKLRHENFAVTTSLVYDKHFNDTLNIKVYCSTKEESRTISEYLNSNPDFKYHIYVPIKE